MWSKTINDVAEQLYYRIGDLDVCLMVAKYYVKKRIHRATEEEREFHMSNLDSHGHYRTDHKLFCGQLRYLSSKTTIRGQYWRASAAAWQIPNLNKKNLTLKDKLNDLKYIPRSMLTGVVMKYWFHDKENDGKENYITV